MRKPFLVKPQVITQNVDSFHPRAHPDLSTIELHGYLRATVRLSCRKEHDRKKFQDQFSESASSGESKAKRSRSAEPPFRHATDDPIYNNDAWAKWNPGAQPEPRTIQGLQGARKSRAPSKDSKAAHHPRFVAAETVRRVSEKWLRF